MDNYTEEQKQDVKARTKEVDTKIKAILDEAQLGVKVLPAFQEIENGQCVAIGIIQYFDTKYTKKEETPVVEA